MKTFSITFLLFAAMSLGLSFNTTAQCEIGDIEATPTPCDSMGYFNMVINFEYANTGSQGFSIQGSGMNYGNFEYSDLPVIIYDLAGDGTTYYEFVAIDLEFPTCSNFIDFGTFDCNGGDCLIWNVDVFPQPCDSGYFYVDLGFWHENTGSMGFRVQGNGNNYGNFEYDDLPITIGPLEGDGITEYEFVVLDNEFEGCSDWAAIDPVDCPGGGGGDCEIGELTIDDHPCDSSGMFYVYFDFDYANVSDSGFILYINGNTYGTYFYEDLPIENLGPFEGDGTTIYHFLVRDADVYECASDANFGPIDCNTGGDCDIWDLVVDDHPCDGGMFNVLVNFEYEHVSDSGFALYVNYDLFGYYFYEELPLENIGPFTGDGATVYHFMVVDSENEYCAEDINFGPILCDSIGDCNIWDVYADVLPCNEAGYFNVALDFEFVNVGNDGFRVQGNGTNYGNFTYDSIPLVIGPLLGDGTTVYEFVVIDNQYGDCSDWTAIDPVECDSMGDCEIGELDVTILPCNDDNEFFVLLNFDYANTSDLFTVQGGGMMYGSYLYADLPVEIGPLSGDGMTTYAFAVIDSLNNSCAEDINIGSVSCDSITEFMNFSTQVSSCDGNMYELQMDFDVINGGSQGFMIMGNGEIYGSYDYTQLPVTIGPLQTDGSTPYHFLARDKEAPVYGNWDKLIPFTCESLGIEQPLAVEDLIIVYPNPSYGSVSFENLGQTTLSIEIYNSSGAEIRTFSFKGTYKLDDLNSGMYFYRVMDEDGNISSGKLVVNR